MAQYNKSFNFKNGLQVDYDNFIVNASGLVGIGSSIPSAHLDVVGSIVNTGELVVGGGLTVGGGISAGGGISGTYVYSSSSGISTFLGSVGVGTTGGLTADPQNTSLLNAGIVTARAYFGDGSYLSNIVGFATTKLIVHQATGGGANSGLATATPVGLGTNLADVKYDLLIGHEPENAQYTAAPTVFGGLGFVAAQGTLKATGIITASGFVGAGTYIENLDADHITTGTLLNARLPVIDNSKFPLTTRIGVGATAGISTGTVEAKYLNLDSTVGIATAYAFVGLHTGNVTGNVTGNLTGNADTATTLNADSSVNTTGIITATGGFVGGGSRFTSVGIGTTQTPAGTFQVQNGLANVDVFVTSENNESTVAIGKSSVITDNNAAIRFNNSSAGWWESETARPNTLDILNYSQGNINFVTNPQQVSGASSEGVFTWRRGANVEPSMVYDPQNGRLSIGSTKPEYPLDISGIATFRSNTFVDGTITATSMTLENALTASLQGSVSSTDGTTLFVDKGTNAAGANAYIKINSNVNAGVSTFAEVHVTSGAIGINTDPNASTNANYLLTINNKDANFNQFIVSAFGQVGVKTDQFYDNVGLAVPTTFSYTRAIGVGRTPGSAVDFGVAGNAPSGWKDEDELIKTRFMIPPTVTEAERASLRNNENGTVLPSGSLIFNSTHNQLQMYVRFTASAGAWVGIGTTTLAS